MALQVDPFENSEKTETEMETGGKLTQLEVKGEFAGSLTVMVSSDPTEMDQTIVLAFRHWFPFMDTSLHLRPTVARQIGEMLIAHAERALHVAIDPTAHLGATEAL